MEKDTLTRVEIGEEYSRTVAESLRLNGWQNIQATPQSNDFGIDITAEWDGVRYGFQCKCFSKAVGRRAVQEVVAGLAHYKCQRGIVVTNSTFTKEAMKMAKDNNVMMLQRYNEAESAMIAGLAPALDKEKKDNVLKGWNHEWDGQRNNGECDSLIVMKPQIFIDADNELTDSQNQYREMVKEKRKKHSWPAWIEENYGTPAALSLIYGLEVLYDFVYEPLDRLVEMQSTAPVGDLEFCWISEYLPERYASLYDAQFLSDLLERISFLMENASTFDAVHKPIDEIIIYMAAKEADAFFDRLFENSFTDWVSEFIGDEDMMMYLYPNPGNAMYYNTDLGDYAFENWFQDILYNAGQ